MSASVVPSRHTESRLGKCCAGGFTSLGDSIICEECPLDAVWDLGVSEHHYLIYCCELRCRDLRCGHVHAGETRVSKGLTISERCENRVMILIIRRLGAARTRLKRKTCIGIVMTSSRCCHVRAAWCSCHGTVVRCTVSRSNAVGTSTLPQVAAWWDPIFKYTCDPRMQHAVVQKVIRIYERYGPPNWKAKQLARSSPGAASSESIRETSPKTR
jgi:hypothetical protein